MEPKASLIDPKSVTFWISIFAILKGVASLFGVDVPIPDEVFAGGIGIGLRRALK